MLAALNQQQRMTHTERGNSWATCAPFPAVVHDNAQEGAMASPRRCAVTLPVNLAGCNSRSLYSHRRAVSPPAVRRSGGEGFLHLRSRTLSMQRHGSRRSAAHSMPVKPSLQLIAYRVTVHNRVLSNASLRAGFNTSEASNGRVPKPTRAFPEKKGELPNVGC